MSSNIGNLAYRQLRISRLMKYLEGKKSEVRDELFKIAKDETPEYALPLQTFMVPKVFFESTGLTDEKFVETRLPSWDCYHIEENESFKIFMLRKKPEFFSYSASDGGYEISKSVSETTPEIDWESMAAEDFVLFSKLAQPVTTYELKVDEFQKMMHDDPTWDAQGFLMRHSIHKKPVIRVLSKVAKDE